MYNSQEQLLLAYLYWQFLLIDSVNNIVCVNILKALDGFQYSGC